MNGKFLRVLRDMYVKAKSCVKTRHGLSQFFVSNVGLRQGGNLSPVVFSLFLNDLKGFLMNNNVQGLNYHLYWPRMCVFKISTIFCICFYCCTRMTQLY